MSLIQLIVVLVVTGIGLWLVNSYIPMAAPIKTILNVVVVIVVIIYVLYWFGILDYIPGLRR